MRSPSISKFIEIGLGVASTHARVKLPTCELFLVNCFFFWFRLSQRRAFENHSQSRHFGPMTYLLGVSLTRQPPWGVIRRNLRILAGIGMTIAWTLSPLSVSSISGSSAFPLSKQRYYGSLWTSNQNVRLGKERMRREILKGWDHSCQTFSNIRSSKEQKPANSLGCMEDK
jgi:hypothetical protein